jgi:hypothetical protein
LLDARALEGETLDRAARVLAGELGWDDARVADEIERYRATAAREGLASLV